MRNKGRNGHTSAPRYKKVMVYFREIGREPVVDNFLDKKSKFIFFKHLGRVPREDVKAIRIIRAY